MKADLHIHSTSSDGHFSPTEIVQMSNKLGLEVISITDHESVEGVAPAIKATHEFPGIMVIPGVEVSTDIPHGEIHLLGYFINFQDSVLIDRLLSLRHSRQVRAKKMVGKLSNMGIGIKWERVKEIAGDASIGRPHIAQAMMERGYVPNFREAFTKYIGREGPAYVEREKMTPVEAVELLVNAGGLPVLAHPVDIDNLDELIPELIDSGLAGIEVYYNGYSDDKIGKLESLAKKYSLLATGGSDFHGIDNSNDSQLGSISIPSECVYQLIMAAKNVPVFPQ